MKKKVFLSLMAVVPLFVFSCSKSVIEPEVSATQEIKADPWTVIPMDRHFVGNGNLSLVADYSEGTKSQLSMNGAGTFASVLWTAGNKFDMINASKDFTTYTATGSGAKVTFTGGAEISTPGPFYCVYPSDNFTRFSTYNSEPVCGILIPHEQEATIGGVAEDTNVSFALAATQSEDLHFYNVGAIIKFKLSGNVVSNVKRVTLGGGSYLSGTFVVAATSEGKANVLSGVYFPDPQYTNVSLVGDFVESEDYYIVVAPGVHDTFYMKFENVDGTQSTKKFSSKELTLNQSRITDFGTINLGDDFDQIGDLKPYIEHKTEKYATIAVIPDGYTADELDQYIIDARSGVDALFNTEPYKSYIDYFNVWILKVPSAESGARISDGSTEEKNRDCYFQSSWGASNYGNMKANANRVFNFVSENCPDIVNGVHIIKDVPVLIIINDTRYGGIAWNYSNGKTYCMVPKSYDGKKIKWNYPSIEASSDTAIPDNTREVTQAEIEAMGINKGTWRNTLVHEFGGHSIGKLGDEYWYDEWSSPVDNIEQHSWTVPMMLNVSAKSDPAFVPWSDLFEPSVVSKMAGISPKYNERIGVFQGADVSMFYRWRSERISCMIDNRFYFSTWQRYIIVNRIMTLSGLPSIDVMTFLDKDDPTDPLRDNVSSEVLAQGVIDIAPAVEVPMLPPPVYAHWED